MRKIYLMLVALMVSFASFSQITMPYYQDFDDAETFMAGDYLGTQVTNTTYWTTWSDAPGTSEDGTISDTYAESAPNSVMVDAGTDLVFLTGGFTEGRYQVEFDFFIPDSTQAYYNFLQEFAGGDSKWAYQIQFDHGVATLEGGVEGTEFTFDYNEWMHMSTTVDLNADWCEIYWDGVKVHEFVWSYGTSATNTLMFDAINFYAWSDGGTPEYYFDNLAITQLPDLPAAANLVATVENDNDVVLAWDAPTELTPDSYSVFRDGYLIEDSIETLTYTDAFVYPKAYEYAVKAVYYGMGVSPDASAEVTIEGGVARKTVLFESIISAASDFSPSKMKAFDLFYQFGKDVSVIAYNFNDEFATDDASYRLFDYYGVTSWTQTWMDGTTQLTSYTAGGDEYANYKPAYDVAIEVPSVVDLAMEMSATSETEYELSVTATEEYAYFEEGLKLHVAVVESHIPYEWLGMDEMNYVLRGLITGTEGYDIDLTSGTAEFDFSFEIDPSFNVENCQIVAFVQDDASKFVVQAMNMMFPVTEPEMVTVYDIQYVEEGNDSPLVGTVVETKGVVVAKDNYGFYLQDGAGAWNGIYVYGETEGFDVADSVMVVGEVAEYNALTEIKDPVVTVINSGNTIADAAEVTAIADFQTEMYEGVLVTVNTVMSTDGEMSGSNWNVVDANQDTLVIRNTMVDYTPVAGTEFARITGLGGQYYETYQLYPRTEADIVPVGISAEALNAITLFPNPVKDQLTVSNIEGVSTLTITNLIGQVVMNVELTTATVNTSELTKGIYVVTLVTEDGKVRSEKLVKE